MKINLEVLTSVSIKRKKPWPKFAWIGQEKEKLLLLDKNRASILSLLTGKTKKNVGKLNSLLNTITATYVTSDGLYLIGVLTSGSLFVWQKDSNALWTIEGLQNLACTGGKGLKPKIHVFSSQNVDVILTVTKLKNVFLWERHGDSVLDPKQNCVTGIWSAIIVGTNIPLPIPDAKDAVVEATFLNDRVLGKTGLCTFIFNNSNCVCISTVHLKWHGSKLEDSAAPDFEVHWHSVQYAFHDLGSHCQPVLSIRAYVPRYAKESLLLALAINQKNAFNSRLVFVCPLNRAFLAVDLQGCGARSELSANKRCYQIADLVWTTNDAHIAGITHYGCFFLVSRLGDLLLISTHGCEMDLSSSNFLNVHPVVKVRPTNKGLSNNADSDSQSTTSTVTCKNIMKQHFTVAAHPNLPVILCSDGFLVTCMLMPQSVQKSTSVMESLVLDANKTASILQGHLGVVSDSNSLLWSPSKTSAAATQTPRVKFHSLVRKESATENVGQQIRKKWEEENSGEHLESLLVSDLDTASSCSSTNITDLWNNTQFGSAGKIVFGETLDISKINPFSSQEEGLQQTVLDQDVPLWRNIVAHLISAWGMAVSNPSLWDDKWEVVTTHTVKSFIQLSKLFSAQRLEHSVETANSESTLAQSTHHPFDVPTALLFKCLDLLQFNIFYQNLMPAAISLIDGVVNVLLNWCNSRSIKTRGAMLLEVVNILTRAEAKVVSVYHWEIATGCSHSSEIWHPFIYSPAFAQYKLQGGHAKVELKKCEYMQSLNKRFTKTWKQLYKAIVPYWLQIQKHQVSDSEYKCSQKLLSHIQEKLQKLEVPLYQKHGRVKEGTLLCLRGCYDEALGLWNKEKISLIRDMESSPHNWKKLCSCLHSILYTFLQNCEFSMSLQFINMLITGNLRDQGEEKVAIRVANQHCAVTKTVLTMARFMARYFTCCQLFIYPPYHPKGLPSLLAKMESDKGCMMISREVVQAVVVGEGLSSTWTPETALSLFLLGGSLAEAAWFTLALGDWKMAFLLAVVCTELGKGLSTPSRKIRLPLNLHPIAIMTTKLKQLVGLERQQTKTTTKLLIEGVCSPQPAMNFSKHATKDESRFLANRRQMLTDHMTAGILSGLEIVPGLVRDGITQLEVLIKDLTFCVPSNFYLPAPPFYCLQDDGEPVCAESNREVVARTDIASIIQLILDIYKSSRTLVPIAFTYATHLANVQEENDLNATQKCVNILEPFDQYQEHITKITVPKENGAEVTVAILQKYFRLLCIIVWLLHCRDEKEIMMRKLWNKLETTLPFSTKTTLGQISLSALHWTKRLTPFISFMEWNWDFYQNLLSLVLESSSTIEVASVFAECIPDLTALPSQMEPRVQLLMKHWQTVSVKTACPDEAAAVSKQSLKIMWLSDYYFMKCKDKDGTNGVQDQFLGLYTPEEVWSKAWIFESDPEFLEFITLFFDVIIHKNAEEYILNADLTPLVCVCREDILQKELVLMAHDVVSTMQKKKLVSFSPIHNKITTVTPQKRSTSKAPIVGGKKHNPNKRNRLGLFQTSSNSDLLKKSPLALSSVRSVPDCGSGRTRVNDPHEKLNTVSSAKQCTRRTHSMSSLEQQHCSDNSEPKQCHVFRKGNNTTAKCGLLIETCVSYSADCCSLLSHVANFLDPNIDMIGSPYKTSHLISWLYRWTNKAHLQFKDTEVFNANKSRIRIQICVDHILAAITIVKTNYVKSELTIPTTHQDHTEEQKNRETEHVNDDAKKPIVDYSMKPLSSKFKVDNEHVGNSREHSCEPSRIASKQKLIFPQEELETLRSEEVNDFSKKKTVLTKEKIATKLEDPPSSLVGPQNLNLESSDLLSGKREIVSMNSSEQTKQVVEHPVPWAPNPSTKISQEVKIKAKSASHRHHLSNEQKTIKEVRCDSVRDMVNVKSRLNPESENKKIVDGVKSFYTHTKEEKLQLTNVKSLPKINESPNPTKCDSKRPAKSADGRNSLQKFLHTDGSVAKPLLDLTHVSIAAKADSRNSSVCSWSAAPKLKSCTENSQLSLLDNQDDDTLDDVTSPDSMQISPPVENKQKLGMKTIKHSVHFAENTDLQRNNFGIQLLTVDTSYLHRAWQDKIAQAMRKPRIHDGKVNKKTADVVPHFLRLKAERDSDDSTAQDISVSRPNSGNYSVRTDDVETNDSERLRGGGSRHKQPFPLFSVPPVLSVSQPAPIQPPNIISVQPTRPHRGYPLLHLPRRYHETGPVMHPNAQCHVCNQDSACEENIYVQGRLRQYWQDVQQASYCPTTISDPFRPLQQSSRPLVPVPLTIPCCQLQNVTCLPPSCYQPDNNFLQHQFLPYSVVPPPPQNHDLQMTCPERTNAKATHPRPRPRSATLLSTTCSNGTLQNVNLNKMTSVLSTVPSSVSNQMSIQSEGIALGIGANSKGDRYKSTLRYGIKAVPSISAPDLRNIHVRNPILAETGEDTASLGAVVTKITHHNQVPAVTKTTLQHPDLKANVMLPKKADLQTDDVQSMRSHGEVNSMQSHNYLFAAHPKHAEIDNRPLSIASPSSKQVTSHSPDRIHNVIPTPVDPITNEKQDCRIIKMTESHAPVFASRQIDKDLSKQRHRPTLTASDQNRVANSHPEHRPTHTGEPCVPVLASCDITKMIEKNATQNAVDPLSAAISSGTPSDGQQKQDTEINASLSNSSIAQHLSPQPTSRVEFAESHFRAIHELEKAKQFLAKLHTGKEAVSKHVQTEADVAAERLARCLEELEKTVQKTCAEYSSASPELFSHALRREIPDCRVITKTQKSPLRRTLKSLDCKAATQGQVADDCRTISKVKMHTSIDHHEETAFKGLTDDTKLTTDKQQLTTDMQQLTRKSSSPLSCLTSDLMLYGRVAPGATSFKHKFNKTTPLSHQQRSARQNRTNQVNNQHQAHSTPLESSLSPRFGQSRVANGHATLVGISHTPNSKRKLTNDEHTSSKRSKASPYPDGNYSENAATTMQLRNEIIAMIRNKEIEPAQSTYSKQLQMQPNDPSYKFKNDIDEDGTEGKGLQKPLIKANTPHHMLDSTCELYGRRFRHDKFEAPNLTSPTGATVNCTYFPLADKSEGEQDANDKSNNEKRHKTLASKFPTAYPDNQNYTAQPPFPCLNDKLMQTFNRTEYSLGSEDANSANVESYPFTHSGFTSTKYLSSPIFKSCEDKGYETKQKDSPSSSLSWPTKHVQPGTCEKMRSLVTEGEKQRPIEAQHYGVNKLSTSQKQFISSLPKEENTAAQCMSSNTIHRLYQDIMQHYRTTVNCSDPTDQCSDSLSPFRTGTGKEYMPSSSNRQTSGQDPVNQANRSLSKIDSSLTPAHLREFAPAQPTITSNNNYCSQPLAVDDFDKSKLPELSQEKKSQDDGSPHQLLRSVEMPSPYLINVSENGSDPPTDELPRRVAMRTVHRRLQNINDHIQVMEKISNELETDFHNSKELSRHLIKNTMSDSVPSAYSLAVTQNAGTIPFNHYQFKFDDRHQLSSKNKQPSFEELSTRRSNLSKMRQSRSLSPPSTSVKSKSLSCDEDTHSKCTPTSPNKAKTMKKNSPHRLTKFGSFQQLLLGNKDIMQDVVSSETEPVSNMDRALARQARKDVHVKLRMQEACQLMDEIVAAETAGPSSSIYSSSPSTCVDRNKGRERGAVDIKKTIHDQRSRTTLGEIESIVSTDSDETSRLNSAENQLIQKLLHDRDMSDADWREPRGHHFEHERLTRFQESLGKKIKLYASCDNRVQKGDFNSRKKIADDVQQPYPTKITKGLNGHSDHRGSTSKITINEKNTFAKTYSLGQPITLDSTIAEVSEETDPTSNCGRRKMNRSPRMIVKSKTSKSKVPKRKLAVRMTRAALLRKKLSRAKVTQGLTNQRQVSRSPASVTRAEKQLQINKRSNQLKTLQSNPKGAAPNVSSPSTENHWEERDVTSTMDTWKVPENIQRLLQDRSPDNSTDADQTTEGFDDDFLSEED